MNRGGEDVSAADRARGFRKESGRDGGVPGAAFMATRASVPLPSPLPYKMKAPPRRFRPPSAFKSFRLSSSPSAHPRPLHLPLLSAMPFLPIPVEFLPPSVMGS